MISLANPTRLDDVCISEAIIGRLHHATEDSVLELVATFHANDRASLALHCYRKSHLRQIGLTIASTCELSSLVRECGPALGEAIFDQSRERPAKPVRSFGRLRPAVTLACSAGGSFPPLGGIDELPSCGDGVAA